jgi:hypothetical protein
MKARTLWSRILKVVGGIAMLLGSLDPMEGSLLILTGSGLAALGVYLGGRERRTVVYWVWGSLSSLACLHGRAAGRR